MNTLDAVVTRVLDVRPYRHFWIVEVEVVSWGDTATRPSSAIAKRSPPGSTRRHGDDLRVPQMNEETNYRRFWRNRYLYRPLLAVVLAPDGLSRLSCFLCGVGGAVVAYYNEIDPHALKRRQPY
jgi:hypothetical protein